MAFKIYTIGFDRNYRSTLDTIDVPMNKISDTESVSPRVTTSTFCYITEPRMNNDPRVRTHPDYPEPFEMHSRDLAHMVVTMHGHGESLLQDGATARWGPGDMHFTRTGAIHHSSNNSSVISMNIFVLFWGGTEIDLWNLEFK